VEVSVFWLKNWDINLKRIVCMDIYNNHCNIL